MIDFFKKEFYTEADILSLIEVRAEESVNMEFKASGSLAKEDKKTIEIGKDVSAFANSGGGIIIYGLSEKDHVADALSFIDGNLITKEWLENIINGKITRPISDVNIYPIRFDNKFEKSVYVVKIPASSVAPHMNCNQKYYKRNNFSAEAMLEYEVRNLYSRTTHSELEIEEVKIETPYGDTAAQVLTNLYFNIKFQVRNISDQIEHSYKLELHAAKGLIDFNRNKTIRDFFIRNDGEYAVFSFPNKSPIFQNELTTIASILFDIDRSSFKKTYLPLKLKLYYSNGLKFKEFEIATKLAYKDVTLMDLGW